MEVVAIISEFNPFHDGHKYLIEQARKNGATHIVSIMSGNFVQRGDVAIYSKWDRARMALCKGVDLVIEIPTCKCLSSAKNYAFAGVEIAEKIGCIDKLCFGSECNDINKLTKIVEIFNSQEFINEFENEYKEGVTYPVARQKAFEKLGYKDFSFILSNPNDILAIEYINAIKKLNSKIIPFSIKRLGASHDSFEKDDLFQSATYIRNEIYNGKQKSEYDIHYIKILENIIFYKLRTIRLEDLKQINDVDEGLESRIKEASYSSNTLEELFENIKTKRYTMSRIRRIVLSTILDIKRQEVYSQIPYIKVLGFNENGQIILKKMKNTASLPIVMKYSDIKKYNFDDLKKFYENEIKASNIYALSSINEKKVNYEQKNSAFLFSNIDKTK